MDFPRWKVWLIYAICALGLVFAFPNFIPTSVLDKLPDFFPKQQVYLGLDLRGGVSLLLEVDTKTVTNDYMNQSLDAYRSALRKEKIGYTSSFPKNIAMGEAVIDFDLNDESKIGKARGVLNAVDSDFEVVINGTHVKIAPKPGTINKRIQEAVNRSIEIVRKRVDENGTREVLIQRQGDDRILVQIPGLQDPSKVKELLGRTAKMTFRLVDENAQEVNAETAKKTQLIGAEYLPSDESGKMIPVKKQVLVDGGTLTKASMDYDEYNQPVVKFEFNKIGAMKFGEATKNNVGKRFAIVLDNKVISAPNIKDPIMGGAGVISGNFTVESAKDLALLLRAGALPAPLKTVEERTVGPDLGADSIRSGVIATIMSVLLVVGFMFMWYSSFGMIANIAVIANLILTVAVLSLIQATLTLPGIAGIALTVGMAVDANVLINERIKEEIRAGAKILQAIENGYNLAMSTIVDTNLNTIIGMFCLYQFGTGSVRGFAITTGLGIIISFFTSTTLTRFVVSSLIKSRYKLVVHV